MSRYHVITKGAIFTTYEVDASSKEDALNIFRQEGVVTDQIYSDEVVELAYSEDIE